MPTPLTEKQVLEYANTLEADYSIYRKEELDRLRLYGLYKIPNLPKDLQRGAQVNMLSPALIKAAHAIRSDLLPMLTEITCLPLARDEKGMVKAADKKAADSAEHSLALILDELDHDRRLSRNIIWRQLVNRLGIFTVQCKDLNLPYSAGMSDAAYEKAETRYMAERFMWSASDIDPITAAWMEKDGEPTAMMRRYRQTISEMQRDYTRRRTPGGISGQFALDSGGRWDFKAMTDDYAITSTHTFSHGFFNLGSKTVKDSEMIWLDDGEFVYHYALNPRDNKEGKIAWYGPNYLGRCSAFLVPGSETPLREPENRYEPYLYPLMVLVEQLNTIRTIRATAARNRASRQAYAPYDPDTIRELKAAGLDIPTTITWETGSVPYTMTKEIKEREVIVDPDMDKLEQRLEDESAGYKPAATSALSDPSLIKESTLGALLNAQETAMRMLGPLVTAFDSAKRAALKGIEHSICNGYKGDYGRFTFIAPPGMVIKGKTLKDGGAWSLDAQALEFPHKLLVSTKMVTLGQAAAAYEYRAAQYDRGHATEQMVLEAANITDTEEFYFEKAKEQIVARAEPWVDEQVQAALAHEIELELGIIIPMGNSPVQAGQPGPGAPPPAGPAANPIAGNRTNAPSVPGPPSAPSVITPPGGTP